MPALLARSARELLPGRGTGVLGDDHPGVERTKTCALELPWIVGHAPEQGYLVPEGDRVDLEGQMIDFSEK